MKTSAFSTLLFVFLLLPIRSFGDAPTPPLGTNTPPSAEALPADFIDVFLDEDANCQTRDSQHVSVKNTHPSKTIRVWLDRYYRGHYSGDRSRSDLAPKAEPEGLGCATISGGKQEWRVVRALFLD